jgi:hypothetical protein
LTDNDSKPQELYQGVKDEGSKLRAEDYEFMKSLLYLCHDLMETITNSALTLTQVDKMREKLQATERLYFEAEQTRLA